MEQCQFVPTLYKLYKQRKICPSSFKSFFLSTSPPHSPVKLVSPSAGGQRRGGGTWGTYHGAAERPEPPEESQGQQQEQDQQGDCQDGAIGLWGQERRWSAVGQATGATRDTWSLPLPALPLPICRFKAREGHRLAKQMDGTLPSIWATHST